MFLVHHDQRRAAAPARTPPSACRSRFAPCRSPPAATRPSVRGPSAASAAPRWAARSAGGIARPAAASGRSPGTTPARCRRVPAPPRPRAGRPRSCRCPSRRRAGRRRRRPGLRLWRRAPRAAPRQVRGRRHAARRVPARHPPASICTRSIQSLRASARAASRQPGCASSSVSSLAPPPLTRCPSSACCRGARRRPCSASAFTPVAVGRHSHVRARGSRPSRSSFGSAAANTWPTGWW